MIVLHNALLYWIRWFGRQVVHRSGDQGMLLPLVEHQFEQELRCGPRCSFCATTHGPFLKVESLFVLRMCPPARSPQPRSAEHRVEMTGPDQPSELLAHHDPGKPWLKWRCHARLRPPGDAPVGPGAAHRRRACRLVGQLAGRAIAGYLPAVERLTWNTDGPACGHQIRGLEAAGT
jgi:hypothetical protein